MKTDKTQVWLPGEIIPEPPKPEKSYFEWLSSPNNSVLSAGKNLFNGFTSGLTALPMSFFYPFGVSPAVSKVESRILLTNFLYLGLALGLDYLHDKAWNEPEDQPQSTAKSFSELTLFILVSTPFLINNSIHYLSLQSAVSKETFPHLEGLTCDQISYPNKDMHGCSSQTNPNIPLLLSEPLANLEIAIGLVLSKIFIPDYGLATRAFHQVTAGTFYANSLIQNRLSTCLEGSRDYVANHMMSVVGYGISMMALTQLITLYLYSKTGRDSALIYDAIFSMVYAQFIVHSSFAKFDFKADPIPLPMFYPVHTLAQDFIARRKQEIIGMFMSNRPDNSFKDILNTLIHNPAVRLWTTMDFRSLDQALSNSSIKLYMELTQPTWMKVIDGVSEIPDNTGVRLGKRIEKWGKMVGFKSAQTDLARSLWEISKKGYFSEEFLNPIRASINKAAGVPAPVFAPVLKKQQKPKVIELKDDDNEFVDASEFVTPATHTQRTQTFTKSYNAVESGRDGKRTLSNTPSASSAEASTIVHNRMKKTPIMIVQDYDGTQKEKTTIKKTQSLQ